MIQWIKMGALTTKFKLKRIRIVCAEEHLRTSQEPPIAKVFLLDTQRRTNVKANVTTIDEEEDAYTEGHSKNGKITVAGREDVKAEDISGVKNKDHNTEGDTTVDMEEDGFTEGTFENDDTMVAADEGE